MIKLLRSRLTNVENDMGNKFKDEFNQIDDVLDDFEKRLDELEILSESNLRDIKKLDARSIEYTDLVKNTMEDIENVHDNIINRIKFNIITNGLRIGRWTIG